MPDAVMGDVYDGKIWQDFQYVSGQPLLPEPHNFALIRNVDWYQPFKHSPYSVDVIYLAILNLPGPQCAQWLRFKHLSCFPCGLTKS